ncbi:hypothetical protein NEAUS04_0514 [Nematocida ausubeli]|uniref:Uncharacterized protein n=1 Tax=Nematocida ausubeli (strain ATCC PRA-371 / ERTm2) TaxID=1913371 RepID=A0A086IZ61_NEMA1|nr:uncharacterized protein NESG_02399 [Nematocida ausubeli]KAI5133667.1 hypothetical protein NEAUS06_0679 [Nematocida ausubeli]KAI5135713.1 hypothetical protein NEAUS06_1616 [Nematocida ausubeli]KAI5161424.1 hypothetical protein NEAUS04_0514 [Nematocida ausubeli]KFG25179.1 hypothetical protein NESG_02399 [Nematocida ausubeli]
MKSTSYWLLQSILEEIAGDKKSLFAFGASIGTKIAEEMALKALPEETVSLVCYTSQVLDEYFECTLQTAQENGEVHIRINEELPADRLADKAEIIAGIITAVVGRVQNKRVRAKTYGAQAKIVVTE